LVIHILALLLGSVIVHDHRLRQRDFVPVDLVDVPTRENPPPQKKIEAPAEVKKLLPPPPPKIEKTKSPPQIAKAPVAQPEAPAPLPAPIKEQPAKAIEAQPTAPANLEPPPSFSSSAKSEGGGSQAGAGALYSKGDIGVIPGTATSGGGGGTAASGVGRGSGVPGLPAQPLLRTNREAKPIQTVRANYPPMALRMGMESDVTLRIEVDAAGNVTRAEVVKSGGAGFDEEALNAVKQSRFEPAQKDGQNVPAEFTYIYRFRLQR
jgi:TonB family protein